MNRLILNVFLLLISFYLTGQTTHYPNVNIQELYSKNQNYFLKTIPFNNIGESTKGETIVFNKDSIELYRIPFYFETIPKREIVLLSNDGKTVYYIVNESDYNYEGILWDHISIFKNGKKIKSINFNELNNCDSDKENCYLFYQESIDTIYYKEGKKQIRFKSDASAFEKKIFNQPVSFNGSELHIYCKDSKILKIDPMKGFELLDLQQINEKTLQDLPTIKNTSFDCPYYFDFPMAVNGNEAEVEFAKFLDMRVWPEDSKKSHKYKKYTIKVEGYLDYNGKFALTGLENFDNLDTNSIKSFFSNTLFNKSEIPKEIKKWRCSEYFSVMNKKKKIAKEERRLELIEQRKRYEENLVADSINGLYIPMNIEECFVELDKILIEKDIAKIKGLKDKSDLALYHFSLGMWLRNNWGLWTGSRLQLYFINKGVKHPDSMSGKILEYYHEYLNENNTNWRNFDKS